MFWETQSGLITWGSVELGGTRSHRAISSARHVVSEIALSLWEMSQIKHSFEK